MVLCFPEFSGIIFETLYQEFSGTMVPFCPRLGGETLCQEFYSTVFPCWPG